MKLVKTTEIDLICPLCKENLIIHSKLAGEYYCNNCNAIDSKYCIGFDCSNYIHYMLINLKINNKNYSLHIFNLNTTSPIFELYLLENNCMKTLFRGHLNIKFYIKDSINSSTKVINKILIYKTFE